MKNLKYYESEEQYLLQRVKDLYEKYSYANLDKKTYRELLVQTRTHLKNKENRASKEQIDQFMEILESLLKKYIIRQLKNSNTGFIIISSYVSKNIQLKEEWEEVIVQWAKLIQLFIDLDSSISDKLAHKLVCENTTIRKMLKVISESSIQFQTPDTEKVLEDPVSQILIKKYNQDIKHIGQADGVYDLYNMYYEEIGNMPSISREEERELIKEAQQGNKLAKEKLVKAHQKWIIKMANEFRHRNTSRIDIMDLVQAGNIGLLRAIDAFDINENVRLLTYAEKLITQEMICEAEHNHPTMMKFPKGLTSELKKYDKMRRRLQEELGREPTESELGKKSSMTEEKRKCIELLLRKPCSLDDTPTKDGKEKDSLKETLADVEVNLEEQVIARTLKCEMKELLDECNLTPKEREVIKIIFYQGLTQTEAAKKYNVSRQAFNSPSIRALQKLRIEKQTKKFLIYASNPSQAERILAEAQRQYLDEMNKKEQKNLQKKL